jgi:hypothetical protein
VTPAQGSGQPCALTAVHAGRAANGRAAQRGAHRRWAGFAQAASSGVPPVDGLACCSQLKHSSWPSAVRPGATARPQARQSAACRADGTGDSAGSLCGSVTFIGLPLPDLPATPAKTRHQPTCMSNRPTPNSHQPYASDLHKRRTGCYLAARLAANRPRATFELETQAAKMRARCCLPCIPVEGSGLVSSFWGSCDGLAVVCVVALADSAVGAERRRRFGGGVVLRPFPLPRPFRGLVWSGRVESGRV